MRNNVGCVDLCERVLRLTRNLEVPQQLWQGCVSLFRLHFSVPTTVSTAVPNREGGTVFQSEESIEIPASSESCHHQQDTPVYTVYLRVIYVTSD